MILLFAVVYTHLILRPILVQKFDFFWYVLDVQLISVLHNIPEKYFTATDAHQLKIWVKLRKIVVEGCHTRPLVIGPLAAGFASLYDATLPLIATRQS